LPNGFSTSLGPEPSEPRPSTPPVVCLSDSSRFNHQTETIDHELNYDREIYRLIALRRAVATNI
jgi:hypothetical protein